MPNSRQSSAMPSPASRRATNWQSLIHHRTLLPRHSLPPQKGKKCNPCVRYNLLPMCRVAHLPSCSHRLLINDCLLICPLLSCTIITHMRLLSIRGPRMTFHSHCLLAVTRFWTLKPIQNSYNNFHFPPCAIFKVMSSSGIF